LTLRAQRPLWKRGSTAELSLSYNDRSKPVRGRDGSDERRGHNEELCRRARHRSTMRSKPMKLQLYARLRFSLSWAPLGSPWAPLARSRVHPHHVGPAISQGQGYNRSACRPKGRHVPLRSGTGTTAVLAIPTIRRDPATPRCDQALVGHQLGLLDVLQPLAENLGRRGAPTVTGPPPQLGELSDVSRLEGLGANMPRPIKVAATTQSMSISPSAKLIPSPGC
jgi:hypothetical protein